MSRVDKPCTEASECRSCRALILWCIWPNSGKRMPVDVGPVPDGDIVLTHKKQLNQLWAAKASHLDQEHLAGRHRFTSHFATCPNAAGHRTAKPQQSGHCRRLNEIKLPANSPVADLWNSRGN